MRNYKEYFNRMSNNIDEKIEFILNELETDNYNVVVDYGCADGQTTRALADRFSKRLLIVGYDTNEEVIKNNIKNNTHRNIIYIYDLQELSNWIDGDNDKKKMLFMSSVTHEMFSFKSLNIVMEELDFLFHIFDTIAIRDMFFTDTHLNEKIEFNNYGVNDNVFFEKDFELFMKSKKLYTPTNQDNAEFILKQRYKNNFKEELKEHYFVTEWLTIINTAYADFGFNVIYDNQYMNSFLLNELPELKKFTHTTHRKLILKRRK